MADSTTLDDFFAKKDKSKKTKKTKTASADVDDSSKIKKDKRKKSDKTNNGTGSSSTQAIVKDDEEWKDFEDEKEIDYTGLKIQNMQIAKEDQEKENDDDENEDGEDGEDGEFRKKRSGASGPWNKSNDPTQARAAPERKKAAPEAAPVAAPEPAKEETPTPKGPSKYVPPGVRQAALQGSTPNFPSSRRKKEAPNMHSEEDFPTLGGGPGAPRSNYPPQYSNTRGADLIDNTANRKGVKLTLENKFSALQD